MKRVDYLVIGSGIAGLSTALHLQKLGKVLVITKGKLKQANTYWAQGGIAAVMTKEDRFKKHIDDTLEAGAHHNNRDAVRHLVEGAPKAIRFLEKMGVKFRKEPALEGGHSEARIWRTSDFTGQDIMNVLIKKVKGAKNISVQENTDAVELIVRKDACRGVFVRVGKKKICEPIIAQHIILATGGLGQLYEKTSNPKGAGGDGLALAVNAGLELEDLEFVQFHPTALSIEDDGRYFLLSETLRGFGAKIIDTKGESFLEDFDPRGALAPRDIVTRGIFFEMMNNKVYLDMRHLEAKAVKKEFPNIFKRLKKYGFDLTKDLIPINPVAHFSGGGVPVDHHGATQLTNLYAVGEVACSHVHGANRLASNALLEGVVFAEAIARTLEKSKAVDEQLHIDERFLEAPEVMMESLSQVKVYSKRLRKIMWERAGIIRKEDGLRLGLKEITEIPARDYRIQNRQLVCYKLIQSALRRRTSLGCHYITSEVI